MDIKALMDLTYGMYVISTKVNERNQRIELKKENEIKTSINKLNYTDDALKINKRFAVSILSEETNPDVISKFGFYSSRNVDKFENMDYEEIENVPVVKNNICGYMICEVINIIECETHDVFFARVIDAKKENSFRPMTYSYYHEVIKGKAPQNAPTYVSEVENEIKVDIEGEEVYVCIVCGYVHKGPMPNDFKCPVCGVDRTMFKKKK